MQNCISKIQLAGSSGSYGDEVITFRPSQVGYEIKLLPQREKVAYRASVNKISFRSDDGDQWGELFSGLGGSYRGNITVDQDFTYSVKCVDKTIGFE